MVRLREVSWDLCQVLLFHLYSVNRMYRSQFSNCCSLGKPSPLHQCIYLHPPQVNWGLPYPLPTSPLSGVAFVGVNNLQITPGIPFLMGQLVHSNRPITDPTTFPDVVLLTLNTTVSDYSSTPPVTVSFLSTTNVSHSFFLQLVY